MRALVKTTLDQARLDGIVPGLYMGKDVGHPQLIDHPDAGLETRCPERIECSGFDHASAGLEWAVIAASDRVRR